MEKHVSTASTNGGVLDNSEALAFFLKQVVELYTPFGNRPPPIPPNAYTFAPCQVEVTDDATTGRIRFLRDDGTLLHDAEWALK